MRSFSRFMAVESSGELVPGLDFLSNVDEKLVDVATEEAGDLFGAVELIRVGEDVCRKITGVGRRTR